MSEDNIKAAFNRVKNLVYSQKYEKYKLNEIARLIKKEPKTKEDLEVLEDIYKYVNTIARATEDLGTKLLELSSMEYDFVGLDNVKKVEANVREIVYHIDEYVDSLSALSSAIDYDQTRFALKNASTYLKAIRTQFLQKSNEFKIKMLKNPEEENNFKMFINDILTIFVQEAYSLRILVLKEKLEEVLNKDG